jgi:hypothetical protein
MSAVTPQELLNLWASEQLSTEMATGKYYRISTLCTQRLRC